MHALRTIALIQFIILHPLIGFAQYTDSKVIQSLAHNLFVCMDILFLLSGYFIYFSISKENLKNYYIKRLIRIIPTFYIAFILYFYLIHQKLNKTSKIINLNSDNNQLLYTKRSNYRFNIGGGMFYLSRIIYQRESLM